MFLCCFPSFRGSRLKKVQSKKSFSFWRPWRKRQHQPSSPSDKKKTHVTKGNPAKVHPLQDPLGTQAGQPDTDEGCSSREGAGCQGLEVWQLFCTQSPDHGWKDEMSSNEDSGEELADEFTYDFSQYKGPVCQTRSSVQCWSESANEDIIEDLVDCLTYALSQYKGPVCQARSSIHCRSKSSYEDNVEELADGFTYALSRYMGPVCQARSSVHCRSKSSHEDNVEELADGFTYALNRYKGSVRQARSSVHCRSESSHEDIIEELFRGPDHITYQVRVQVHQADSTDQGQIECAAELTLHLPEARWMRALQRGTLEKVAASVIPAFPAGNIPRISTYMSIHPAFSRAQQFLDQLCARSWPPSIVHDAIMVFTMSGGLPPYNYRGDTPQDQVKKAIASTVGTWPHQIKDFGQPLVLPWFQLKQALVLVKSPALHHVGHPKLLWVELEHLEPTQVTPEGPPPQLQSTAEPEEGSAQGPAPGPARGPPRPRQA